MHAIISPVLEKGGGGETTSSVWLFQS
uniref:Uncharacterized protein n=1 Tax=Anguilla anguilla TaxID=7936 RepID=A0A0E9TWU1_ANGAN